MKWILNLYFAAHVGTSFHLLEMRNWFNFRNCGLNWFNISAVLTLNCKPLSFLTLFCVDCNLKKTENETSKAPASQTCFIPTRVWFWFGVASWLTVSLLPRTSTRHAWARTPWRSSQRRRTPSLRRCSSWQTLTRPSTVTCTSVTTESWARLLCCTVLWSRKWVSPNTHTKE